MILAYSYPYPLNFRRGIGNSVNGRIIQTARCRQIAEDTGFMIFVWEQRKDSVHNMPLMPAVLNDLRIRFAHNNPI